MTKRNDIYKCSICGNIVEVLFEGEGELVCCGQPMDYQEEKTGAEKTEWHRPVIEKNEDGKTVIKVGQNPHPMTNEHSIQLIEIFDEKHVCRKYLTPNEKPEYVITSDINPQMARACCNLHGLWKN